MKLTFPRRFERPLLALYLGMGWVILSMIGTLITLLPRDVLVLPSGRRERPSSLCQFSYGTRSAAQRNPKNRDSGANHVCGGKLRTCWSAMRSPQIVSKVFLR